MLILFGKTKKLGKKTNFFLRPYNQANDTTKNIPNNIIEELEAEEEQRLLE